MVGSGYLEERAGRYHVTPKGRIVAAGFRLVKSVWSLGSGG
jgi:hypothetical protein